MPSSWSAGASGKQAKKQVKSKRACEQKLIVKERESLQAYFYIPHFINSPPPLTSKRLWSRRVLCASRVRLRVHFPPKLFMSIEGNIVYVLQIFPRKKKKGGLLCSGTKVHLVYFTQFGLNIVFFSFTGGKRLAHVVVSHGLKLQNEGLPLFDW